MSAETLRRAATLMRNDDDPRWLAVADWMDNTAYWMACDECNNSQEACVAARRSGKRACCPDCYHGKRAMAVALARLGSSA